MGVILLIASVVGLATYWFLWRGDDAQKDKERALIQVRHPTSLQRKPPPAPKRRRQSHEHPWPY